MKIPVLLAILLGLFFSPQAQLPSGSSQSYQSGDLANRVMSYNEQVMHKTGGVQTDLPTLCYSLLWDPSNMVWDSVSRFNRTYKFAAGEARLDTLVLATYAGMNWITNQRTFRDYDTWGNTSFAETQLWNGSSYDNYRQEINEYDSWGTSLKRLTLEYNGTNWDSLTYSRASATYNSQAQPTEVIFEERDFFSQSWLPVSRVTRAFDSNFEMDSLTFFSYASNVWQPQTRRRDIDWHNHSQNWHSEYYADIWDFNVSAFAPQEHSVATYSDAFGSNVEYVCLYNSFSQAFDSTYKNVREVDAQGNTTLLKFLGWNDTINAFEMRAGERTTYTYNAYGSIVEAVSELWFEPDSAWSNNEWFVCQDFAVGSAPEAPSEAFAQWATHPIAQQGKLLVQSERPGTLHLKISDINGTVVADMKRRHSAGQQFHVFELGLPAGIYVYELSLNGAIQNGKVQVW